MASMMTETKVRRFIDAPQGLRCKADITLRDGSQAQCGRYAKVDGLCRQHKRLCDCEYPEPVKGVALVSNQCPIHNFDR